MLKTSECINELLTDNILNEFQHASDSNCVPHISKYECKPSQPNSITLLEQQHHAQREDVEEVSRLECPEP